nr:autotransporter-associated beta strand repeat-containing protein [Marinicella sp. W31]MDC2875700.1 autotransporter-associated beta strand repeat-containing protein [Marinicella sp. W31]
MALVASTALTTLAGPALAGLYIDGTATVDGVDGGPYGTAISESNFVSVGVNKASGLTVSRGGTVTAPISNIGSKFTSTTTITGAGSRWFGFDLMRVGSSGEGKLNIMDGGQVSGKDMVLGAKSDGLGKLYLVGSGSGTILSGTLTVGDEGVGMVNLSNGGTVTSVSGVIGGAADSDGAAIVSGAGTVWTSTGGELVIGGGGSGVVTLTENAKVVASDRVFIARDSGASGTLNVGAAAGEAAASVGIVQTGAIVFGAGDGKIVFNHTDNAYSFTPNISGKGTIEAYSGTTTLDGDNSAFTGSTEVYGGTLRAGNASAFADNTRYRVDGGTLDLAGNDLTVSDLRGKGGLLTSTGSEAALRIDQVDYTGFNGDISGLSKMTKAGFGTLVLRGDTDVSGQVSVEEGTLSVVSGKMMTSDSGLIAASGSNDAGFEISGAGARWNVTSGLRLGDAGGSGSGNLWISDQASVSARSLLMGNGGKAQAEVSGIGSVLSVSGSVEIGGSSAGSAAMVLTKGGRLVAGGGAGTVALAVGTNATGTLVIGAQTGKTPVAAGILEAKALAFGAGDGNVVFNHTDTDYTFAPDITGAGHVDVYSGTTILTGNNSYTGGTKVEGGILRAGADGAFAANTAYTVNGGMLDLNGHDLTMSALSGAGGTIGLGTGGLTISQDSDTAFAGSLTGSGTLALDGTGRLRLTGASSAYSGDVRIASGTLEINNAFASGAGFIGTVAGEYAQIDVTGPSASWALNGDLNIGRRGSGALVISDGGVVKTSGKIAVGSRSLALPTGKVTVTGSGSQLSTGASGSLEIGSIVGSTLVVEDGGSVTSATATLGRSPSTRAAATVTGAGSLWTTGSMKVGDRGTGILTLADRGTMRATNTFDIGSSGTLNIGARAGDAASAAGFVDTSLIDFGTGSGTIVFNHTDTDYTFSPDITGAGHVGVYSGTTILTGKNSYTGGTDVFGGKLVVNGTTGAINVASAATLAGSGTVGDTVISGVIAPGNSIGTLNVAGDLSLGAGSVYQVEVNDAGTQSGINSDF